MGWSWSLACLGACLVNFACANEDWFAVEQREIDFDEFLLGMSQEGPLQEEAPFDRFIEQRPVDHLDLIKDMKNENSRVSHAHAPHVHETLELDAVFKPRGQPIVRPHSFEGPYVLFPPGQPTLANLQAICLHSRHRPRYPPHSLPLTGFSWKRMEGDAINLVESWFGMCCQDKGSQGQEVTLCCVKQAWESSLNSFCQDQFSVKMRHHHCCKKIGDARMSCFQNEAPNPAYEPKEETPVPLSAPLPGFTFDPNTCQSPQLTPRSTRGRGQRKSLLSSPRNMSISFPPGRPTAANIKLICRHLKLRPVYLPKCLPSTGFGWLARQSKAINRVEKGFKRCCKGQDDTLTCADQKWREEMNSFCREAKGPKSYFPCCVMEGDERYNCFSSQAPHPGYDKVLSSAPLDPNFGQLCETHKFIPKKFPIAIIIQNVVNPCCSLSDDLRTACVQNQLMQISERLCSDKKPSSSMLECCTTTSQDTPKCLANQFIHAIAKTTKSSRPRKRMCPLF